MASGEEEGEGSGFEDVLGDGEGEAGGGRGAEDEVCHPVSIEDGV